MAPVLGHGRTSAVVHTPPSDLTNTHGCICSPRLRSPIMRTSPAEGSMPRSQTVQHVRRWAPEMSLSAPDRVQLLPLLTSLLSSHPSLDSSQFGSCGAGSNPGSDDLPSQSSDSNHSSPADDGSLAESISTAASLTRPEVQPPTVYTPQ